jgi:E3 ubiquitin-protein ligase TRIP12
LKFEENDNFDFLEIYFTLPANDKIELKNGGKKIKLNSQNLKEYKKLLIRKILELEKKYSNFFLKGLLTQIDIDFMKIFSATEIKTFLSGDNSVYFSIDHLEQNIFPDFGYDKNSQIYKWFLEIIQEFKEEDKKDLILFLTGNKSLPYGGFEFFTPKFKVVRKYSEDTNHLPSVMTCQNFLKIPDYKDKNSFKEKLLLAIKEGNYSFLLS